MDPARFQSRVVREAFNFCDRAELAFQLLSRIERQYDLELMLEVEPAKSALDWASIRASAAEAYKLKLYDRRVLGPVFPKTTIKVVERIVEWVEGGGDAPADVKGKATHSVADLLCYLAERHRGLSSKLRAALPRSFFSEGVHRPEYEARMKQNLGLFAGAFESA